MAGKNISTTAIYYYLIYWIVRTKNDRLEYRCLPFDIAGTSKKKIIGAFTELKRNKLINKYRVCEDGIVFSPSLMLSES